jgi:hypothetical protein
MSFREFTDAAGVRWQVWATTPSRGNVRPQFAAGWLAFECAAERRRLAPIPPEWTEADHDALCAFLAQAAPLERGPGVLPLPLSLSDAGPEAAREAEPDAAPADPAPGSELESTMARVREVLRTVEETWQPHKPD